MDLTDYTAGFRPELVVIPCGVRKLDHRAQAADMYIGSYHRACRRAAEALQPDRLVILSAFHGLLDLSDEIDPYDIPHGHPDAVTVPILRDQAERFGVTALDPVVILGGARHVALATAIWPHARTPLTGTRGMGEQFARLTAMARAAGTQPPAMAKTRSPRRAVAVRRLNS
ncbi:DUF6884 domain-containing protein [Streptomyces sp. NPDC026673]|uniref:DUF6884 domain-containing protein n=1 Tax=Streptomyces sp. NPDC026673 TaxID=3155724 RepID=UPI0033F3B257